MAREKVRCAKCVGRAERVVEEATPLFVLVVVRNRSKGSARGVKELGKPKRWAMR